MRGRSFVPLSKAMVVLESMAMAASTAEMEPIMTTEKIGLHRVCLISNLLYSNPQQNS